MEMQLSSNRPPAKWMADDSINQDLSFFEATEWALLCEGTKHTTWSAELGYISKGTYDLRDLWIPLLPWVIIALVLLVSITPMLPYNSKRLDLSFSHCLQQTF